MSDFDRCDLSDFDRYCDEHNIAPGDEPVAFAAWLEEKTGQPIKATCETPEPTLYPPTDWVQP